MTYLEAAGKADEAATYAGSAWRDATGEAKDHQEYLAQAVRLLAEAVSELAQSMHRAS